VFIISIRRGVGKIPRQWKHAKEEGSENSKKEEKRNSKNKDTEFTIHGGGGGKAGLPGRRKLKWNKEVLVLKNKTKEREELIKKLSGDLGKRRPACPEVPGRVKTLCEISKGKKNCIPSLFVRIKKKTLIPREKATRYVLAIRRRRSSVKGSSAVAKNKPTSESQRKKKRGR